MTDIVRLTPEEMLTVYMAAVRSNDTVTDVAIQAEHYEIRAEIIECWENHTGLPILEDDMDHVDAIADIATHAVLALCRAEAKEPEWLRDARAVEAGFDRLAEPGARLACTNRIGQ